MSIDLILQCHIIAVCVAIVIIHYNLFINLDSVLVTTKDLSTTLRLRVCVTGHTNTCRMITHAYTAAMVRGNRNLFHPVHVTGDVKTVQL